MCTSASACYQCAQGTHAHTLSLLCTAVTAPKTATVAVTSDKGLCGGLNSNIAKYTRMLLKLNADSTGEREKGLCLSRHLRHISGPTPMTTPSIYTWL